MKREVFAIDRERIGNLKCFTTLIKVVGTRFLPLSWTFAQAITIQDVKNCCLAVPTLISGVSIRDEASHVDTLLLSWSSLEHKGYFFSEHFLNTGEEALSL